MRFTLVERSPNQLWPTGRSGHRMCADDNFVYLFGGYNPHDDHAIYNELWRYNTSSNTWLKLPDKENMAPKAGASISMVYLNKKIITFGGTGYPFAEGNSKSLSMYCLNSYRWYDLSTLAKDKAFLTGRDEIEFKVKICGCSNIENSAPLPKYGQSLTVFNDKLYIFAGTSGSEFENDLHSFCLSSLKWTQHNFCSMHREFVPLPRYRHEAITTGDRLYILGGATSLRIYRLFNVQYFDCMEGIWHEVKCTSNLKSEGFIGYPEPRQSHVCIGHKNRVYLVGGLTIPGGSLDDIWSLDMDKKEWRREKDNFPYSVYFHSGAITSYGSVYTFGGTNQFGKRMDDLHQAQLDVLTLKRQAWLFVVKILQNNGVLDRKTLKLLGIPKCFAELVDDKSILAAA